MAPAPSRAWPSKVATFSSDLRPPDHPGRRVGSLSRSVEKFCSAGRFLQGVFADLAIHFRPLKWEADKNPLAPDGHGEDIAKQARVIELTNAYRVRGHLIADIDPLRTRPIVHHPELELETHGLTIWDLDREFWSGGLKGGDRMPLREIIAVMRRVYCGKVGIEYRHISSPDEKNWIASGSPPRPRSVDDGVRKRPRKLSRRGVRAFSVTKFLGHRVLHRGSQGHPAVARLSGRGGTGIEEVVRHVDRGGATSWPTLSATPPADLLGLRGVVHPDFPADEGASSNTRCAHGPESRPGREIALQVESNPSHLGRDPVSRGGAQACAFLGRVPRLWPGTGDLLHGDALSPDRGWSRLLTCRIPVTARAADPLVVNNQMVHDGAVPGRSSFY